MTKQKMSEGKKAIITNLIEEYEIKSVDDIQEAMKDLLGETIQEMLESEMEEHLGYEPYERSENENSRNGYKPKRLKSKYGEILMSIPQDRESEFEPKIVPKNKRDISKIDDKIISMYAKGLSVAQISEQIEDIYGFEVSESMVSSITNKILPQIEEWQNRPLSAVYPIIFIDGIVFSVRDNNMVKKMTAYVIIGINSEGRKEVLSITIGESESSKYWLTVLNELKNRGVTDIMIICADGLSGMSEAINAAYPQAEYQRCIVHQVRNTLKHVAEKDRKEFAEDLRKIYHAPKEEVGYERMLDISEKWESRYPNSMKRWRDNWDSISPMFKFSMEVRKVIYTTNSIESLNSGYRRLNRARSVFPSSQSLLKAMYLATFELTKKWTVTLRNWGLVYGELSILYDGRLS